MTPEEIEEQTRQIIAESNSLVEEAVNQATLAATAFASGNYADYWQYIADSVESRLDDQYHAAKAKAKAEQAGRESVSPK